MKRDMDLERAILFALESADKALDEYPKAEDFSPSHSP